MKRVIWLLVAATALFILYMMVSTPTGPNFSIR